MENKIQNLFNKYWHVMAFGVMVFCSLSFLILQRGVWIFADSGFYYSNIFQSISIAVSKLGFFSNTDGFYFGFDNSSLSFSHLIISIYQVVLTFFFGPDLGQILYYFIYYLLVFYFGIKLLSKFFPKANINDIRLGALFISFNPFSLLIVTLFTIGYIYTAFIVFTYALISFLESGRVKYLVLAAGFGLYLLSYLRLIPIIIILLVFIVWLFYDQKYFNWKRILVSLAVFILSASPFLVGNILSLGGSDNVVTNYQDFFSKYEEANYSFKKSFINSFSHPGGFTPSALSFFYNNRGLPDFADNFAVSDTFEFYKTIQIIFNIGVLVLSLYFFKNKLNLKIISLICVVFFLNTLGFFISLGIFNFLNSSLLLFLYNDYGFIQFIQSFLYGFLVVGLAYNFRHSAKHKNRLAIFFTLIIVYLFLNLIPFFSGHYGFKKLNPNDIPENYQETIFTKQQYDFNEATIFTPYHWLKFKWSPYYLDLNFAPYSKYKSLIVPNLRLIDEEFVDFYNQIYDNFDQKNFPNVSIFNVKNIILFRDVEDANENIDTYRVINLENNSKKLDLDLVKRLDLFVVNNNDNFVHYRLPGADDYDFLVYSPKTILSLDLDDFYTEKLLLHQKPVLFNKGILNKVNLIKDINFKLNSPFLEVKSSKFNSNKYLVKASVNKDFPFLIQLNQSYSKFWKVYFITKDDWDNVACENEWIVFKTSENSRCSFNDSAFNLGDLRYLNKKSLKSENHFAGNLIGNGFVINPDDIPAEFKQGDELYLLIYFEKQFYYLITLTVSILTFGLLGFLAFVELLSRRKGKYE